MRLIAVVCCLAFGVSGCRSASRNAGGVADSTGALENGKIPITTRSADARAIFLRARALNETLKPHEAHALFEEAVSADPAFAMGEYSLASTAPTATEVSEHLQKALALAGSVSPGERLVILGMQARNLADRVLARQLAESLVARYPRDERAHSGLAIVYSGQQLYGQAIAEYEKAIAINPAYSIAYNQLGYAYRSAGNMDAAESAFTRYIALIPDDPNPYDSYAELLMKMGRFDESIAQYQRALSIDRHFGGSYVGIAADEMFAGRYDAAAATLQEYYAGARDDAERRTALLNLAMVCVDQGATDRALEAMARSAAIARVTGDIANLSADGVASADILLDAGRIDAAGERYGYAHDLVATSGLPAAVKEDNELARHYDAARVALARHNLRTARVEAVAYSTGAAARKNDTRIRQAHELNGLLALEAKQFAESLAELGLADQENPAVWHAKARAYAGKGDIAKATELSAQAVHVNILPTLPYVFTRAALVGVAK